MAKRRRRSKKNEPNGFLAWVLFFPFMLIAELLKGLSNSSRKSDSFKRARKRQGYP